MKAQDLTCHGRLSLIGRDKDLGGGSIGGKRRRAIFDPSPLMGEGGMRGKFRFRSRLVFENELGRGAQVSLTSSSPTRERKAKK